MDTKYHIVVITAILLSTCSLGLGIEQLIDVEITQEGNGLKASVHGSYMGSGCDDYTTYYPVPPDAFNVNVNGIEPWFEGWSWSTLQYETLVLPEQSLFLMLEWSYCSPDTCPITTYYGVYYDHYLLQRPNNEYIFFYANESYDFLPDPYWPHGRFSGNDFNIYFPECYEVKSVTSGIDYVPIDYEVTGNKLEFYITKNDPNYDRLIVTLEKHCNYVLASDQNDDCRVDFIDHAILAQSMTEKIDFQQVAVLAENWLIDCCIEPTNPACVPK